MEEILRYQKKKKKKVLDVTRQARETLFKTIAIGWRRKWQLTPVFLPEESHGQRSLAGHGPWDRVAQSQTRLK